MRNQNFFARLLFISMFLIKSLHFHSCRGPTKASASIEFGTSRDQKLQSSKLRLHNSRGNVRSHSDLCDSPWSRTLRESGGIRSEAVRTRRGQAAAVVFIFTLRRRATQLCGPSIRNDASSHRSSDIIEKFPIFYMQSNANPNQIFAEKTCFVTRKWHLAQSQ